MERIFVCLDSPIICYQGPTSVTLDIQQGHIFFNKYNWHPADIQEHIYLNQQEFGAKKTAHFQTCMN